MNETRSLTDAANDDFNGCTSDELRGFCNQLGIQSKSNNTREWMIRAITEKLADGGKTGKIEAPAKGPRNIDQPAQPVNLMPVGKWGGRRRLVELHESETDGRSTWRSIAWDQNQIFVKAGMQVSIPYPHYNILKDAIHEVVTVTTRRNIDGTTERVETVRKVPTMPFTDFGDDPETAHLPRSWHEAQIADCRSKNYYKDSKRANLTRLLSFMTDGAVTREQLKEMSDEEIREQVIIKLGLYDECMASDFFLENAA